MMSEAERFSGCQRAARKLGDRDSDLLSGELDIEELDTRELVTSYSKCYEKCRLLATTLRRAVRLRRTSLAAAECTALARLTKRRLCGLPCQKVLAVHTAAPCCPCCR